MPIQPKNGNLLNRKDIMKSMYNKNASGCKKLPLGIGDAAHSYRNNKAKFATDQAKNIMLTRSE